MGQPSVTIYVDYKGTPHTFVKLDNGSGTVEYYGFAPSTPGSTHTSVGNVGIGIATHAQGDPTNSRAGYMDDVGWSKSIEVTSTQYQAMIDAKDVWHSANHSYDFASIRGGENCTDFVNYVLDAGNVTYPGRNSGFQPLNLIPTNEQQWVTDADGRRHMSDALRDPLNTPGTPAYEYKQAHPDMFVPPAGGSGTQDQNTSDLHWNADGTYTQEIAQIGALEGDSQRIQVTAEGDVIQLTETDGAHNNADYASRVTTYDTEGRTDSVNVYRDDGSRDWTDYDQAGARGDSIWSNHIDAQGREDWRLIVNDDGSRDWTDYDQTNARGDSIWSNRIDAQGREDWRLIVNDDGSRDSIDYDQTNARGDSIWSNHSDAQGREDYATVTMDDGGRTWYDYDQTNVRGDSIWSNHTDAQGREDWRSVTNDDGSRDWTDYDQANTTGANRWEQHFDAQGREDWLNTVMDDGTRLLVDNDQDGSQGFNQIHHAYDAQGREGNYTEFYDNGTRLEVDIDELGNQNWNSVHYAFDAQGREGSFTIFNDSGTRLEVDLDELGNQSWSSVHHAFDAQGREGNFTVFNDGGTRLEVDLDELGNQSWNSVHHAFDAQSREDYATMFLDDGGRNTYDYDQDGSQRWSRMESHFGANGRAEYSTTYNDDGSRLVIDHDYNGHFGEHGVITYSATGSARLVGWTKDGYDGLIFTPAGGVIGANGYASGPPSFGQFPAALPYLPALYSDPDGAGPSWTIETPWGVYHGT